MLISFGSFSLFIWLSNLILKYRQQAWRPPQFCCAIVCIASLSIRWPSTRVARSSAGVGGGGGGGGGTSLWPEQVLRTICTRHTKWPFRITDIIAMNLDCCHTEFNEVNSHNTRHIVHVQQGNIIHGTGYSCDHWQPQFSWIKDIAGNYLTST